MENPTVLCYLPKLAADIDFIKSLFIKRGVATDMLANILKKWQVVDQWETFNFTLLVQKLNNKLAKHNGRSIIYVMLTIV
jgi:hypothetical protein